MQVTGQVFLLPLRILLVAGAAVPVLAADRVVDPLSSSNSICTPLAGFGKGFFVCGIASGKLLLLCAKILTLMLLILSSLRDE